MTSRELILFIEDEPDIREIAKFSLEDDFDLIMCTSGEAALELAPSIRPTAIILDVMMPGMDGPTTLQRLRKMDHLRDLPTIFMTAKVQPAEVQHYLTLGAEGVVSKPFDPMSLAGQIRSLLAAARS